MMIEPNQTKLDEFDNPKEHRKIAHGGCLDAEKRDAKTRILVMNVNGFRLNH